MEFIRKLKFDKNGLIPCIIQDYRSGEVLMLAYMNEESLKKTVRNGKTCFWSRSRKKFWVKGETSGNIQKLEEIRFDCDNDALLMKVRQTGGACHNGYRSCFHNVIDRKGKVRRTGSKIFDPEKVYGKKI